MQITDNGAKCRLDSFSGRRRCGYLKFPSLGGPHGGEKIKKHPLGGSQGGGNRSPGRPGLRMAAKLFEIEMQITCTHVLKKPTVMYVNYLAPVTDQKKTCGVGGHPTRSGVNIFKYINLLLSCKALQRTVFVHSELPPLLPITDQSILPETDWFTDLPLVPHGWSPISILLTLYSANICKPLFPYGNEGVEFCPEEDHMSSMESE